VLTLLRYAEKIDSHARSPHLDTTNGQTLDHAGQGQHARPRCVSQPEGLHDLGTDPQRPDSMATACRAVAGRHAAACSARGGGVIVLDP
jgi:hypothetical protein